ncbi:hypothetical protein GCM10009682_19060 [Luedemannella flava]|uniref:Gram-positive cocci surface proteins LPxTG domain-containing protein n=1 Tax=Luedemannella flava TaxID=349316 RepID=A0ABN2LRJ2_9ACTN
MRSLRVALVTLVAAIAVGLGPTAAVAQPYPVIDVDISVGSGVVRIGTTVTIYGAGYLPFERIRIVVTFRVPPRATPRPLPAMPGLLPAVAEQTVQTDRAGKFTANVAMNDSGTATIFAAGARSGRVSSATVQSLPAAHARAGSEVSGGGRAQLPVTGSDGDLLARQALVGVVALLAGGGLLWLSARRRRHTVGRD